MLDSLSLFDVILKVILVLWMVSTIGGLVNFFTFVYIGEFYFRKIWAFCVVLEVYIYFLLGCVLLDVALFCCRSSSGAHCTGVV